MGRWFWIVWSSQTLCAELSAIASRCLQRRSERRLLTGAEEHPRGEADLEALADEAQSTRVVAGGVVQ